VQFLIILGFIFIGFLIRNKELLIQDDLYPSYKQITLISSHVSINPLIIDEKGNANYTWEEALLEEWCSGNGTKESPYVIRNIFIDGNDSEYCLTIRNSHKYAQILNSTFQNTEGYPYKEAGLRIINTTNLIIKNNTFLDHYVGGIYCANSSNVNITANKISNTDSYGLFLNRSIKINVSNNKFSYSNFRGIYMSYSNQSLILNNQFQDMESAIWLYESNSYNLISENYIFAKQSTFEIFSGISVKENSNFNFIKNNFINFTRKGILVSSRNNTIQSNILTWITLNCIEIYGSNNSINNNQIQGYSGISLLLGSFLNRIFNNSISQSRTSGVFIAGISNKIFNNTILDNRKEKETYGIRVDYLGANNTIYGNHLENNSINIHAWNSSNFFSFNCIGNYWDDYQGKDINDDGRGDTPYNITNHRDELQGQDKYPLFWDAPVIQIKNPKNESLFFENSPKCNFSVLEGKIDKYWYSIVNFTSNPLSRPLNFTINESLWEKLPDGSFTVALFANDSKGYIGSDNVMIFKDTHAPLLEILLPQINHIYGWIPPILSLEVDESNVNCLYYFLYNNISQTQKYNITTFPLAINDTAWSFFFDGPLWLNITVIDIAGNQNTTQIQILKDISNPQITIIKPPPNSRFGKSSPVFELIIIEPNLEEIWFTINQGHENYIFTKQNTIASWEWLPYGQYNITIYARDSAQNIGFSKISIYKVPERVPTISGYYMFIIIILLGIFLYPFIFRKKLRISLN
jgi:parallel beta-helix repeat protein